MITSISVWLMISGVLVATLATVVWRIFGVAIAGKLDLQHPLYQWFVHVSYAAVAAVLCLNLFVGNGALESDEVTLRCLALIAGIITTQMTGGKVFWGLLCSTLLYTVFVFAGTQPYSVFMS